MDKGKCLGDPNFRLST